MLQFEYSDAFAVLELSLLALSIQILNRENDQVSSIWSHGAWSKQDCSKSRQKSVEKMGLDIWETPIYQIVLEVSNDAAPKSLQMMPEALYPIVKCFKFQPGHESQSTFSFLEGDGRKSVSEVLHVEALMEKFHKENH